MKNMDVAHKQLVKTSAYFVIPLIATLVLVISFIVYHQSQSPQTYTVSGDSMLETLHDGEKINLIHASGASIERNDIATVVPPDNWLIPTSHKYLVKRVVGVPGDQIDVIRGGKYSGLYINNERIYDLPDDYGCEGQGVSYKLDSNHYFITGDNHFVSYDSLKKVCEGRGDNGAIKGENIKDYGEVTIVH